MFELLCLNFRVVLKLREFPVVTTLRILGLLETGLLNGRANRPQAHAARGRKVPVAIL
jgi:hypothetical protein